MASWHPLNTKGDMNCLVWKLHGKSHKIQKTGILALEETKTIKGSWGLNADHKILCAFKWA